MSNFGNVPAGSVLPIHFASYNAAGASVTLSGLAITDVEIYKGITVTQRSSDAGIVLIDTDGIDIDGITGANGFSIDLGDNTDAGFYAVGSYYNVWVSAVTIDGQTVNFLAATFRIVAAEQTAGYMVTTSKVGTGTGEINLSSGNVPVGSIAANAITATAINTGAITAAKFAAGAVDAAALATDAVTEIWNAGTRTLTANTNLNDLSAAGVRAAVGLASANLDTQLADIPDILASTDLIPTTIDGLTFTEWLRVVGAAAAGKASGLATTTAIYRAIDDSKPRITATVDASGNRTAITLDAT